MALEVHSNQSSSKPTEGSFFKRKKVVGKQTESAESSAVPVEWVRKCLKAVTATPSAV
jgi:hypothetical protein